MRSFLTKTIPSLLLTSFALNAGQLDVTKTRDGFSLEQNQLYASDTSYVKLLSGGEVTSWWSENISRTMLTAIIPNRLPENTFKQSDIDWEKTLGDLRANTLWGEMTFKQAVNDPRSALKAMIIMHKGEIVYESYPGIHPADNHLWASVAKPTAALLIEQLIDEGKIKDSDKVEKFLPDFKGSALGDTRIIELLDMVPGTDTHDSPESRANPDSIATRYYLAEFNEAYKNGEVETMREILKTAERTGPAGKAFEYSSGITQMLVFIAEAITQKTWSDAFDERVWSHVKADSSLQINLAPDGMAMAHGIVSSRLRDLARYGLLYTSYWSLVADKQVVSDKALARIADVQHPDSFMKGDGPVFVEHYLGEQPVGQSRQWDAVYADGGIFKGGMFGQGLYVSPEDGLVIAYYSTVPKSPIYMFLRPIAKALKATDN
ncbi:serine hydrolase domain-containing protein [Shewanella gaetbuli]|uniref:Beta-lactamase family protein n=1 Tax=Shewanella gaetbuli TaxID=220752 RepID=A0A9X1ZQ19_9GAMM|nr:serine hydrolase domain-containing protein [Shewanella gaetbuli]MCL1143482.1 beta-lactamase family protein [Shewanella gaetbuli]